MNRKNLGVIIKISVYVIVTVLAFVMVLFLRNYSNRTTAISRIDFVRAGVGRPLGIVRFAMFPHYRYKVTNSDEFQQYSKEGTMYQDIVQLPSHPMEYTSWRVHFDPPIEGINQFYLHLSANDDFAECGTKMFVSYKNGMVSEYIIYPEQHGEPLILRDHRYKALRPEFAMDPIDKPKHIDNSNC